MAPALGGSVLLWTPLLLCCLDSTVTAAWKSMLSLEPPWNRLFVGENVTLTCNQDNSLEDGPTRWMHNGSVSIRNTSHLSIVSAKFQDSGKYECQKGNSLKSKPVYLEVLSDWMLLQASAEVVMEGKSFFIRCHGWKNWKINKVTFYKDDIALRYSYENKNLHIINATLNNSGNYHCTGKLQRLPCASEPLRITIVKPDRYMSLQLIIRSLVVTLFVVDTGLFVSTKQQFKSLSKIKKTGKDKEQETTKEEKLSDPLPMAEPPSN